MADELTPIDQRLNLLLLMSNIVSAQVSNNSISPSDVPALIEQVYMSLSKLGAASEPKSREKQMPAIAVRKSVTPDYIICLEDGKKLKMLRRHLRTAYDMSPEDYRTKWHLPLDYPMVAPNYSAKRKDLALKLGLGRKAGAAVKKTPGRPRKQAA